MSHLLAVDVGTATTAAARWRDGRPVPVPLGEGSDPVASLLYRTPDGAFLAGAGARARAAVDPAGVAPAFKRRLAEPIPVGTTTLPGWELTGRMIEWVIAHAAEQLGSPPSRLLLTCPESWDRADRDLLRQAGSLAGPAEVQVVGEATAAATYHTWSTPLDPGAAVAVLDVGGGGFGAAVLVRTGRGFELCAEPVGGADIGGHTFDEAVLRLISRAIPSIPRGPDGAGDPEPLRSVAVRVKQSLSAQAGVDLSAWIPGIGPTVLTRSQVEDAIRDDLAAIVGRLRSSLRAAEIDPTLLAAVLLAGGSSRMPLVADLVRAELGVPAVLADHPKLAVCLGAVIDAVGRSGASTAPPPADTRHAGGRPPDLAVVDLDRPLEPAGTHWARRKEVTGDQPLVVRLDDRNAGTGGRRIQLRLLLLVLAAALLITAAVLLANRR